MTNDKKSWTPWALTIVTTVLLGTIAWEGAAIREAVDRLRAVDDIIRERVATIEQQIQNQERRIERLENKDPKFRGAEDP